MNVLKLNVPAISSKLSVKELSIRPYINSLSYIDNSRIIQQASIEKPVYRLCKDYSVDGREFSLNLVITDEDAGSAEKFMDKVAKTVPENFQRPFQYLDETYKPKAKK